MTAQFSEALHYKGNDYSMFTNPLYLYVKQMGIPFEYTSTANWRGYIGSWKVKGNDQDGYRLYLVRLSGNLPTNPKANLKDIFPEYPKGVFAHWFSGEVRCPFGEQLKYVHMGYASKYQFDLFLEFKQGVLVNQRTVENYLTKEDLEN